MSYPPGSGTPSTSPAAVSPSAWKSAYGVLAAMILTIPLGVGFFLYEGVFALLSDAGGLLVGLLLAPLVVAVYRLHEKTRFTRGVFALGIGTVAGICFGSLGLVALYLLPVAPETYGAPFLGVQFLGWFLLGFWLLGAGMLGLRTPERRRSSSAAVAAGVGAAGGITTLVYSYAVGSFTLAFPLFMALFAVGFVLWAGWFGGELRAMETELDAQLP